MNPPPSTTRRVAVIGGGMTGLTAAHRLVELGGGADVTLLEASGALGGILRTERRDDFLVEHAADMFTTKDPWALELCRRIGFEDQLIPTNQEHRRAFIVRRGRLQQVPEGFSLMSPVRFWPVATTPLLSVGGKLRLAWEYFTPAKRDDDDESLASFATRRMGRQAYENIIQPLIGGIYTADPRKLSMAATMPQFVEMERRYGSLIRGMRRTDRQGDAPRDASGARYDMFVAPREGMSSLVEAIARRLPEGCLRLNCAVERLQRTDEGKWRLTIGDDQQAELFDAVILATSAPKAAQLLRGVDERLSDDVAAVPHAGASVVMAAYHKKQFTRRRDGFGFVVPMVEGRKILAGSFASMKFAGRAPDGTILLRTFVGGACQPELVDLPDDELTSLVARELSELLGLSGQPLFEKIVRWRGAMPQYHVGHLQLVQRIEQRAAALNDFELAGNAYRGVGIPFCVRSGEQAAQRIAATCSATN